MPLLREVAQDRDDALALRAVDVVPAASLHLAKLRPRIFGEYNVQLRFRKYIPVLREEFDFLLQTFSRSDPQKKISQKSPTSFREWIMNFRFISIFCDEFCIFLRIITI